VLHPHPLGGEGGQHPLQPPAHPGGVGLGQGCDRRLSSVDACGNAHRIEATTDYEALKLDGSRLCL
jgi:hypothetical protein